MKLHIGAFHRGIDGWINTDITPHMWITKIPFLAYTLYKLKLMNQERYAQHTRGVFKTLHYLNLCNPFPYKNETLEAIFSSHVFEHLFLDEVKQLIMECYRVLKKDGVCRVIVPDLEKIMLLYDVHDPQRFIIDIYEIATRSEVKNQHHSAFTGAFLIKLFKDAGFSECEVLSYKKGKCPDIDLLDNRPDSLFFEAIK
jgi:SAM-dependent methyltransferase